MLKSLKFAAIAALPALALATTPVEARDGYYHGYHGYRGGGDDDAAVAIGAGVVGLALGAAIASGSHDRGYYYDDDYYYPGGYYRSYPRYYSYSYGYPVYVHRGWGGYRGGYYGGYHGGWNNYRGDWHRGGWDRGYRWGH